jgi:hypothetical protein
MPRRVKPVTHTRYTPANACDSKTRYKSKSLADAAAELREIQHSGLELDTYQCPSCHQWHLTSRSNTQAR